ncbi:MAG: AAA family ATPase [Methylocystis sp.]|nr:AAA family ATPase [Methylocystis sp.]
MRFGAQDEVVDFLASLAGSAAAIVATHISVVVLGATQALKLKRAVRFPYLDFSTPERRLALCRREVELNRRYSPRLYLGAHRVTREKDGKLTLDGAGALVDAVVVMRRFADDALFDAMARRGALTKELMEALAAKIAQSHDGAAPDYARGGAAAMRRVLASAATSLREAALAPPVKVEAHLATLSAAFEAKAPLLDARRNEGRVRHCHGDLTLRNICLFEGEPTLFDCLEFDDEIATIDVLYDLAFLLMDLSRVGAEGLANFLFNRYLDARDEIGGLPLLPIFQSLRATIRAHVEASQGNAKLARSYFAFAQSLTRGANGAVIAIGGYSGAGKSSVAAALAPRLAPPPGARILNSDRTRKAQFGVAPTARLPQEAYASAVSARVYRQMFDAAARVAASSWPIIVDAVFDRAEDRRDVEQIAQRLGLPFVGIWLDLDFDKRAARVDRRRGDVSDATREVLAAQMRKDAGEIDWLRFDASGAVPTVVDRIVACLPPSLRGA